MDNKYFKAIILNWHCGWQKISPYAGVLVCRTCKQVSCITWQMGLVRWVGSSIAWNEEIILDYPSLHNLLRWVLKELPLVGSRRDMSARIRKERWQKNTNVRRIQRAFDSFKMQGPLTRPTEELLKAKNRIWLTASKEARTSVLIFEKLNSAYN